MSFVCLCTDDKYGHISPSWSRWLMQIPDLSSIKKNSFFFSRITTLFVLSHIERKYVNGTKANNKKLNKLKQYCLKDCFFLQIIVCPRFTRVCEVQKRLLSHTLFMSVPQIYMEITDVSCFKRNQKTCYWKLKLGPTYVVMNVSTIPKVSMFSFYHEHLLSSLILRWGKSQFFRRSHNREK